MRRYTPRYKNCAKKLRTYRRNRARPAKSTRYGERRGLGISSFKAKTRVRIPIGTPLQNGRNIEQNRPETIKTARSSAQPQSAVSDRNTPFRGTDNAQKLRRFEGSKHEHAIEHGSGLGRRSKRASVYRDPRWRGAS